MPFGTGDAIFPMGMEFPLNRRYRADDSCRIFSAGSVVADENPSGDGFSHFRMP